MNHIVYCWELGSNYGHITVAATLARAWQADGHKVTCILKETRYAEQRLKPIGVDWLQAPVWMGPTEKKHPLNHADILHKRGYASADSLLGLIQAWQNLLTLLNPTKLILDAAPTASLAARNLGIPVLNLDNGFFSPPLTTPLPPLRDWEPYDTEDLLQREQRTLAVINQAQTALGKPTLESFQSLLDIPTQYRTWPELNPFGPHSPTRHIGPIATEAGGITPQWSTGKGAKVFAYLRPHHPLTLEVIAACLVRGYRVLAFIPQANDVMLETLHKLGNFTYTDRPVNIRQAIEQAQFGIGHGGDTLGQFFMAGKPMLLLPSQTEQARVARAAEKAGVAINLANGTVDSALDNIRQLSFAPKEASYTLHPSTL